MSARISDAPGALRVLVADDDEALREEVASLLSSEGMSVRQVGSGTDALAALRQEHFDLVVSDVDMPGQTGVEVGALARTAGEAVPILVMTGLRQEWVPAAVGRLQRAALLLKPFDADALLDHVRALLRGPDAPAEPSAHARAAASAAGTSAPPAPLFPPDLVPMIRSRLGAGASLVGDVPDAVLAQLLSSVFFAGLEAEEGERSPVRVLFVGAAATDEGTRGEADVGPLYRWSRVRLRNPRTLSIRELVKLARATASSERMFVEVGVRDGVLVIGGLAREGVNLEGDPFVEILASEPGALSVRSGRRRIVDYDAGHVLSTDGDVVSAGGRVRAALEHSALAAGARPVLVPGYVEAVHTLVGELSSHGGGGILIVGPRPDAPLVGEGYQTFPDLSILAILSRVQERDRGDQSRAGLDALLHGTYLAELEDTVAEIGAVTALDGATLLDERLSLVGFGLVLPVGDRRCHVLEALDASGDHVCPFDLGTRGTRHRAGALWAHDHPGVVVFVASVDGGLSCFLRSTDHDDVLLWRVRSREAGTP